MKTFILEYFDKNDLERVIKIECSKEELIKHFLDCNWEDIFQELSEYKWNNLPYFYIRNMARNNTFGILSAADKNHKWHHLIAFTRPKEESRFFGLIKRINNKYETSVFIPEKYSENLVRLYIEGNYGLLEKEFKRLKEVEKTIEL